MLIPSSELEISPSPFRVCINFTKSSSFRRKFMDVLDATSSAVLESPPEDEPSSKKSSGGGGGGAGNSSPENAHFDCNICLDFASDPVVTLCGHLYCWPCLYRWLHPTSNDSPRHCPVCKFPLCDSSLVPLYGRGHADKLLGSKLLGIPDRPRNCQSLIAVDQRPPGSFSDNNPFYMGGLENHRGVMNSAVGVVLGEMAFAILPSAFAAPPISFIHESPRWRRQEMIVENWLKQLWIFFLCCAILFLLLS
ncbi:E3 ubiquitin-protein ligase RMA3 [Platanthera zijinensis]|uniref:E3 ubiquitin-protein ligase RMA n=1 Tax=Platanthera zijinensis TaxID=2320716 RepID=A0AAP0G0Z9_9ASPA